MLEQIKKKNLAARAPHKNTFTLNYIHHDFPVIFKLRFGWRLDFRQLIFIFLLCTPEANFNAFWLNSDLYPGHRVHMWKTTNMQREVGEESLFTFMVSREAECTKSKTLRYMGYNYRRPHQAPILAAKNRNPRLQWAQTGQLKSGKISPDESQFLVQHSNQWTQCVHMMQCQLTKHTSIVPQIIYLCIILDSYWVSGHRHVKPGTESFQTNAHAASQDSVTSMTG